MDVEKVYLRSLNEQVAQKNNTILSGSLSNFETYQKEVALRNLLLTTRDEFSALLARRESANVE